MVFESEKSDQKRPASERLKCEAVFNSVDFIFFSKVVGSLACAIQHRIR